MFRFIFKQPATIAPFPPLGLHNEITLEREYFKRYEQYWPW